MTSPRGKKRWRSRRQGATDSHSTPAPCALLAQMHRQVPFVPLHRDNDCELGHSVVVSDALHLSCMLGIIVQSACVMRCDTLYSRHHHHHYMCVLLQVLGILPSFDVSIIKSRRQLPQSLCSHAFCRPSTSRTMNHQSNVCVQFMCPTWVPVGFL